MLFLTNTTLVAQQLFTQFKDKDSSTIIFKGLINEKDLLDEPSFTWLNENAKSFIPSTSAVNVLKTNGNNIHILVFGGTWCDDTKAQLPKFLKTVHAAAIAENKMTYITVDRNKVSLGNLAQCFGITNVPTFIVQKNGMEIGRIIEYGTMNGKIDEELASIISKN